MKEQKKLSEKQRQIIVGLILGGGHLETQTNGRSYRIKVTHSKSQKPYLVEWLLAELKELFPGGIKKRASTRNGGTQEYYISSVVHPGLRFYGQQFYKIGKKQIPPLLKKLLTPLSLAIWFMDDGSLKSKKHKTYNIHTLGYNRSDLLFVQDVLLEKFKIETSLHKQKNNTWRIYIKSSSAKKFREIIEPYVIKTMEYKLGNTNAQKVTEGPTKVR